MKSATKVIDLARFPGVSRLCASQAAARKFLRQLGRSWVLVSEAEVPPIHDSYAERRFESALKGPR
ncbi:MAG: hypothetical protein ACYC4L_01635 [Chloroflexota bacterium]